MQNIFPSCGGGLEVLAAMLFSQGVQNLFGTTDDWNPATQNVFWDSDS